MSYMVEEIWQVLAKAKYTEWENQSSERSWKLQSLKYVCRIFPRYFLKKSHVFFFYLFIFGMELSNKVAAQTPQPGSPSPYASLGNYESGKNVRRL